MSHTIAYNVAGLSPLTLTIVNYTTGGEAVTLAELGMQAVMGVMFATVSPGQNSLGVPLFPILIGGAVKLFQFVSGSPVEIPTTSALNAVVMCLILT